MKITVEQRLEPGVVDILYEMYTQTVEPLRNRAAARQLLTKKEFTSDMRDERIDKYIAWHDDGRPATLITLATDLGAMPWISQDFYTTRFPDHAARGAIFYLGYVLAHPDLDDADITSRMIALVRQRLHQGAAVCAVDVPAYDDEAHHIDGDRQPFYAALFHDPDVTRVPRQRNADAMPPEHADARTRPGSRRGRTAAGGAGAGDHP